VSVGCASAKSHGLVSCQVCGLLAHQPMRHKGPEARQSMANATPRCHRCAAPLHTRKPQSLQRSVALLIAAAIFYVPANLLPILHTTAVGYDESDTILSGIIALWSGHSWPLAILVFIASILVPALKLLVLGFLVVSTHRGSRWALYDRTALYRVIDFIGRWSMLDVFVVALMVTLVQFRGIASIHPEPGALAFALVVILMMYAAQAFDPRLMWDRGA
jgi:paraquat-inducible protein A